MKQKTLFTGFAPNIISSDKRLAFDFLFNPFRFFKLQKGEAIVQVEQELKSIYSVQHAFSVDSGRTALYIALSALQLQRGDVVAVQAYTCSVVINAILQSGAQPLYIDIDESANMDPKDLEKKMNKTVKVLLIQHTFGTPAQINKLLDIAQKHELKTIEDCAHAFGAELNGKKLGTFADIGFYSFGSNKVLSCGRGGALITNNSNIAFEIREHVDLLPLTKRRYIYQHLTHFLLFPIGKKFYSIGIGKIILFVAKRLGIIHAVISKKEKQLQPDQTYPSKLPNALAKILFGQLQVLSSHHTHRKIIAQYYDTHLVHPTTINCKNSIYLRYPLSISNPQRVLLRAKQQGVLLGNWYNQVVGPETVDLSLLHYSIGSCPKAEDLAKQSVNLPTDKTISLEDAKRIVTIVNTL